MPFCLQHDRRLGRGAAIFIAALAWTAVATLPACGDDDDNTDGFVPDNSDAGVLDTGAATDTDAGTDTTPTGTDTGSDTDTTGTTGPTGTDSSDTSDTSDTGDTDDTGSTAVDRTGAKYAGNACQYPAECGMGDCVGGKCVAGLSTRLKCTKDDDCDAGTKCEKISKYCVAEKELEVANPGPKLARACKEDKFCPYFMSCKASSEIDNGKTLTRCINNCHTDADCPAEGACIYGECKPYARPVEDAQAPEYKGSKNQIYAGVALSPGDFPWGISTAGYGGSAGRLTTPYNDSLGGTNAMWDRVNVLSMVVDNGEEMAIFVRSPHCFGSDYYLTRTAWHLKNLTGRNYLDKIITGSTHSHSQPARFWSIAPSLGFVGHDSFDQGIFDRYTLAMAKGIKTALDNRRPAKLGITVLDNFDPDDNIHRNRRGHFPGGKDPRAFIIRVDDAQTDKPMGALVSFAMHGTTFDGDNIVLTQDAPGGVEVVGTRFLGDQYGTSVPVMFFNGNAGNVSPAGDDLGDSPFIHAQVVGQRFWNVASDSFGKAETKAKFDKFEVLQYRAPVSYDDVGYDRNKPEFFTASNFNFPGVKNLPYFYGGLRCCTDNEVDPKDGQACFDGKLACTLDPAGLFRYPLSEGFEATFAGVRIDDDIIVTLPGESTTTLGQKTVKEIQDDALTLGQGAVRVLNVGYSMTHHLYILLEDDWYAGGYESQQNIWGPKFGDYVVAEARKLGNWLLTPEKDEIPKTIKPQFFPFLDAETFTYRKPADGTLGKIVQDVPAEVTRGDVVTFQWTGGDPGKDMPYMVLQRKNGSQFEDVLRKDGTVFDDYFHDTLTTYRGNWKDDFTFEIQVEIPFDLPTGKYRIAIEGLAVKDTTTGETEPYTTASSEFDLRAATLRLRPDTTTRDNVAVLVNYPNAPTNDTGSNAFTSLQRFGRLLRTDAGRRYGGAGSRFVDVAGPRMAGETASDVTLKVVDQFDADITTSNKTLAKATAPFELVTARESGGAETKVTISDFETTKVGFTVGSAGLVTVTVTDAFGNTGAVTFNVTDPL
jgi:hypothetical protein